MQQVEATPRSYSLLLYILGFLLFWEWLRPLSVVTDTADIDYFVGFAAFSFFLSYLRFPVWITFPAKFIAMIYAIHAVFFYNSPLFSGMWLGYFLDDFQKNIVFMFNGNWVGLTNLFRSFLFFVLLWIVSYLMHYWLIQKRQLFLFFFITIVYLTVLDTFTMYHADGAIVRTMIIGLILLGLLRVLNIQEREKVSFAHGRFPISWMIALAIMIALTSVVGYAAPKAGPQWPDPVPFIKKATNGHGDDGKGKNGRQTIGYDDDDTKLGGPFSMDKSPLFNTTGEYSHYWRISTKNYYTGKGWIAKPKGNTISADKDHLNNYGVLKLYEDGTTVKASKDKIEFVGKSFPQLIQGGDLTRVAEGKGENKTLDLNTQTGKLEPMDNGRHATIKNYTVEYQYPYFSISKLKSVTDKDWANNLEAYVQLPSDLPNRVETLARNITKDATNWYDKAQAIEGYFQAHGFVYDTKDVPYPAKGQDYVDQFLFETKKGYCDNFSTAMAVMLRSIGIPTRWVKGFTQGEYKGTPSKNQYQYVVRNADAHSWVEVYFPGSGWVPFEPTRGFDNIYQFNYDASKSSNESTPPPAPVKKKPPGEQQSKKEPAQVHQQKTTSKASHLSSVNKTTVWTVGIVTLIVMVMIVILLFITRKKWLPRWLMFRFRKPGDKNQMDRAFRRLLKLLAAHGYQKRDHQTLREFAASVDKELGIGDMKSFTLCYERHRYYKQTPNGWQESKQFWENIIKALRG